MTTVDVFLLALFAFYVMRGLFKGLSGELVSLLSTMGSFYCSLNYYQPLSALLTKKLNLTPVLSTAIAMLCLFGAVYVLCALVGIFFKKALKAARLGIIDKLLGGFSGAVRVYAIAIVLLIVGMILAPLSGDKWVVESKVLGAAAKTWPTVYPVLDSIGFIPDVQSIQKDAQDYIMKQAMNQILPGAGGNKTLPNMPKVPQEQLEKAIGANGEKIDTGIIDSIIGGTKTINQNENSSRKKALKSFDIN